MTVGRKSASKVLLLVDDAKLYDPIHAELGKRHYHVISAEDDVMHTVFDEVPHLIVIDEDYRHGQGRKIAHEIKRDIVLKYIPIILIASHPEQDRLSDSTEIDAYFKKGQSVQKLVVCAKEALAENYNELDLNPLTHLPGNRS
jgi:DNA-binding response OmpR family regulator